MKQWFYSFFPWEPWDRRGNLTDGGKHKVDTYPGVYLLALFPKRVPSGGADPLAPEIIYVGEGRVLRRRLKQFDDSAFCDKPGHSAGWSYAERYPRTPRKQLHVAMLPIWFGDDETVTIEPWTSAFRLFVERQIILELARARDAAGFARGNGLLNRR